MMPVTAPVKNATYRLIIIAGKPKTRPKRKASFMSPPPIAFFLVSKEKTTEIIMKKRKAPIPQAILTIKDCGLMIN
jgi:hypothetical protein